MAHNFTERDQMFTVREPSWHGLETAVFEDYPTREEAQKLAHPWEPVTEPVYRRTMEVHQHTQECYWNGESGEYRLTAQCGREELNSEFEEIDTARAVVRSDTGATLGVVSGTFQVVTNNEMYDIAEALETTEATDQIEGRKVRFETGGSLKGGAKVWLLLRLNEPLQLNGDPRGATIPYYGLQNSNDGSGAFRGQATMTRIVCDNTAQMADLDAKAQGTEFVFRHTKNVRERIEEARQALAGWRESVQTWRLQQEHFVNQRTTVEQRVEFVDRFIPMPPPHAISPRVEQNVLDARTQFNDILWGVTCEGIETTAAGLVAASVEYLNHARRARSQESRFKRAYLDRNRIVTDAVELVQEVVPS